MLEYTDEEVKTLMQTPLNGEFVMQTKQGNREVNRHTFYRIRSAAVTRLDNARGRLVGDIAVSIDGQPVMRIPDQQDSNAPLAVENYRPTMRLRNQEDINTAFTSARDQRIHE